MKYWLLSGALVVVAGLAQAEEDPDHWEGWNHLPEDVLNFSGDMTADELSQQLDTLIQQNQDNEDLDLLLELWLNQGLRGRDNPAVPLQTLIDPPDHAASINAQGRQSSRQERLQQLMQNRPSSGGSNRPGESGPGNGQPSASDTGDSDGDRPD